MNIVEVEEKEIKGISIRTKNADEMNPDTARIGKLYQQFDQSVSVNYRDGARVYGVYFNYESYENGEFTVMAGSDRAESDKLDLERAKIPGGQYMIFYGKGEMPNVVIDTWKAVWEFFSAEHASHKRAYTTDFEYYKSPNEVEIYIAIK